MKSSRYLSAAAIVFSAYIDTTPVIVGNLPNLTLLRRKVYECSVRNAVFVRRCRRRHLLPDLDWCLGVQTHHTLLGSSSDLAPTPRFIPCPGAAFVYLGEQEQEPSVGRECTQR